MTEARPLLNTYAPRDLAFARGDGVWLETTDGRRFLDFASGVAVSSAGHAHPKLVEALTRQAGQLWHVSNLFRIPEQERFARRLVQKTFADRVFFCNSGAEAVECAIKTARRWHFAKGRPERTGIITFEGAFHGRTLATLAAGGQPKYLEGFGPPAGGFSQVPLGDMEALDAAIGSETAGILIEPIQGEGGIREVPPQFLRALRALCDERGLLLLFDEVQTGSGRTGALFAYEHAGVAPDILATAKGIGGGFPLGACLTTEEAGSGMEPGTHGSTYGGNPLAMAVGNAVLDILEAEGFLENVRAQGGFLRQQMAGLIDTYPDTFSEVRGMGLHLGLVCQRPNQEVRAAAEAEGLLVAPGGDNVIRMMPPLVLAEADAREAITRLDRACRTLRGGS